MSSQRAKGPSGRMPNRVVFLMRNAHDPALARTLRIMAWLAAFGLVYINLVPFEYRAVPFDQAVETFRHLKWQHLDVDERARWVSNLLQFVPFGFFACGALGRRDLIFGIVVTAVLGAALAAGIEFAQIWALPRTVSFDDVVAETIGAGVGVIAWASWGKQSVRAVRVALAGGPQAVLAALYLYLAIYAFVFLQPFNFLLTPEEISARLSDPQAITWSPLQHFSSRELAGVLLKVLLMAPAGAAVRMVSRRGPAFAVVAATVFSFAIEIGRWFEHSTVANLSNILLAAIGAGLGYRIANSRPVCDLLAG